MARIRIFYASVNPEHYDIKAIAKMSFDEAVEFFKNDEIKCCLTGMHTVNDTVPSETRIHADGVDGGDGSDTMFNWVKVDCCY